MSTDLDSLVQRVREHDVAALGEFIAARRPQILGFIENQLGAALRRKVEPDDVFQEVGVEAVRSFSGADFATRDPFGWLCQIAERRIIDLHRKFFGAQKRDAAREVGLGAPSSPDASHAAIIDLLAASMTSASQIFSRNRKEMLLYEALASLPEQQREALRLRYVENRPSKEIAERLGKTDGAVRVMLTRALSQLQKLLGPDAAPT